MSRKRYLSSEKGIRWAANIAPYNRERSLRVKFGITSADYDELLHKQGGGCAVCGTKYDKQNATGGVRRLAVDHCHKTGVVRGLLCSNCNQAAGKLKDNVELIIKLALYIQNGVSNDNHSGKS